MQDDVTAGSTDPVEQPASNVLSGFVEGVVVQAGRIDGDVLVQQPVPAQIVPQQLPGSIRHFVARQQELDALTALLDTANTGPVVISTVEGSAGIGKTTLAVYWAHQRKERFPDGQLYVDLNGFGPTGRPMRWAVAVRGFLDAFQVPPAGIPVGAEAQAALFRSIVARRQMLLLLDNARDSDQVRPLLPGTSTCMVIVTSRNRLEGLIAHDGAHRLTLTLLSPENAAMLLVKRIDSARTAAEPGAVRELVELCARLPLALAIVAAVAANRPHIPLSTLVTELRDVRFRLDHLDLGEIGFDLRAVFSWSYQALNPESARLFHLLSAMPGPDISLPAVAALMDVPLPKARNRLNELTRAHLLEEYTADRYRFHDLLRIYAAERATNDGLAADRRDATHRVLGYYLMTAVAADRRLYPQRVPIRLDDSDELGTAGEFDDYQQALAWFKAEHRCLIAACDTAVDEGFSRHAWQLPWAMATFMDRQGHWPDWVATHEAALTATTRLGEREGHARMLCNLGHAEAQRERISEALTHVRQALEIFVELGHRLGEAHTRHSLSWILARDGRPADGLAEAERALALHRAAGHRFGQAEASNTVGWLHSLLGDHEQCLQYCHAALDLLADLEMPHSKALALACAGDAYRGSGRLTEAVDHYQQALVLFQEVELPYESAAARVHLGDVYLALGDRPAALANWRQAMVTFDRLNRSEAGETKKKIDAVTGEMPEADDDTAAIP